MNIQVTQPMLMQSSGIPARQCVAEVYGQYLVTQPQVRRRKLSTIYLLASFHGHGIKNQKRNGLADKAWNVGNERS